MKKTLILIAVILLNLSIISALDISVIERPINDIIIAELNNSASFELEIKNNESTNSFKIFSYVGVDITPGEFTINPGQTETIEIIATPSEKIKQDYENWFSFEYRIAGKEPGTYRDTLKIRIVSLQDVLEIKPLTIFPDQNIVIIEITNKEQKEIPNLTLNFNSDFFQDSKEISLDPKETINISLEINKDIKNLEAGNYNLETTIKTQGAEVKKQSEISYLEQGGLSTQESIEGSIIRKTIITKENTGNIASLAKITERKNVLTRLFTTFSEIPIKTERSGLFVDYTWERALAPNEAITLTITTNYTIPFILLVLVIIIILFVWKRTRTDLILNKRITFVKTKGGEFALRVRLKAKARKNLDDIKITDRIPGMTKIHEKFGTKPDKIDEKTRTISWNLKGLNAGEERTFSYLIYSKIKVIGRFELPIAQASYKSDNKIQHTNSNKTSFAAEGS